MHDASAIICCVNLSRNSGGGRLKKLICGLEELVEMETFFELNMFSVHLHLLFVFRVYYDRRLHRLTFENYPQQNQYLHLLHIVFLDYGTVIHRTFR
jgi:hypothetical protein